MLTRGGSAMAVESWKNWMIKEISKFLQQDIIEFKKSFNALIFRIYEGELREFENLHFVVPWYPPWYRKFYCSVPLQFISFS